MATDWMEHIVGNLRLVKIVAPYHPVVGHPDVCLSSFPSSRRRHQIVIIISLSSLSPSSFRAAAESSYPTSSTALPLPLRITPLSSSLSPSSCGTFFPPLVSRPTGRRSTGSGGRPSATPPRLVELERKTDTRGKGSRADGEFTWRKMEKKRYVRC